MKVRRVRQNKTTLTEGDLAYGADRVVGDLDLSEVDWDIVLLLVLLLFLLLVLLLFSLLLC